ncbi:MAG TPA: GNAT family protein [Candidatus Kapabacteria bacterium]
MSFSEEHTPSSYIPKRIETERLLLKKIGYSYAEEYYFLEKEGMEKHLAPFSPVKEQAKSDAEGIKWMKEAILTVEDRWEMGLDYRFLISEKQTNKLVGQIAITNVIRGVAQSAFVGYWIGFPYLNQGYVTEAVRAIFDFAFSVLNLHRLSLWIAVENEASLRVAEKLGLRYEGTAQKALHLGGRWQDTKIFAITKDEWVLI